MLLLTIAGLRGAEPGGVHARPALAPPRPDREVGANFGVREGILPRRGPRQEWEGSGVVARHRLLAPLLADAPQADVLHQETAMLVLK